MNHIKNISIIFLMIVSSFFMIGAISNTSITKWEYKIVAPYDSLFDIEMNQHGKEGWELVTSRRAGTEYLMKYECILKRRIN